MYLGVFPWLLMEMRDLCGSWHVQSFAHVYCNKYQEEVLFSVGKVPYQAAPWQSCGSGVRVLGRRETVSSRWKECAVLWTKGSLCQIMTSRHCHPQVSSHLHLPRWWNHSPFLLHPSQPGLPSSVQEVQVTPGVPSDARS